MRTLVTGSNGFLGRLCRDQLRRQGDESLAFDLPLDVLDRRALTATAHQATHCLHLAAHKHAPYGEESPAEVAEVNIAGTRNVVDAYGPNVVLASTCKAADPMTTYGASKLIAERIVLNAGGKVVRLVNVWGSTGSVAQIWDQIPSDLPLPVAHDCHRMWMTPAQAIGLLVGALRWPTGRYAPDIRRPVPMIDVATTIHPDRALTLIAPRRGDRPVERLVAQYETAEVFPLRPGTIRITHPADLPAAHAASLRAA